MAFFEPSCCLSRAVAIVSGVGSCATWTKHMVLTTASPPIADKHIADIGTCTLLSCGGRRPAAGRPTRRRHRRRRLLLNCTLHKAPVTDAGIVLGPSHDVPGLASQCVPPRVECVLACEAARYKSVFARAASEHMNPARAGLSPPKHACSRKEPGQPNKPAYSPHEPTLEPKG